MDESSEQYQRWSSLETIESFGNFCKHIGADNGMFWQKIYTHLNLDYTPDSPKGDIELDMSQGKFQGRIASVGETHRKGKSGCLPMIFMFLVLAGIIITIV